MSQLVCLRLAQIEWYDIFLDWCLVDKILVILSCVQDDPAVYTPSAYPTLIGREKYDW